jgi:hypothetical protein
VQRLGDQFLARAAFALDEDGGAGGRDLPHAVVDLDHGGRVADELFQAEFLVELLAQLHVFRLHLARAQRAGQHHLELLEVERLRHVIVGAALHRLDRDLLRAVGGHEDAERRVGQRLRALDQVEPFRAAGQPHVGQEEVDRFAFEQAHRRVGVGREIDVVLAVEITAQAVAGVLLVLHHEEDRQVGGQRAHGC